MQTKTKRQKKMIIFVPFITAFGSGFYYMIGTIKKGFSAFRELDPVLAYSLWFFLIIYLVFAALVILIIWYRKKQNRK